MPDEKKQATVEALQADITAMIANLNRACRKAHSMACDPKKDGLARALDENAAGLCKEFADNLGRLIERYGSVEPTSSEFVIDAVLNAVSRNRKGLRDAIRSA